MGRKHDPTPLKVVRGSRRINPNEPTAPEGKPSCPRWLPAAAKAEWKRITPILVEMGLLSTADMASLAGYCAAFARWQEAEKELEKDGPVLTAPSGYAQPSPYIAIANKALVLMRSFAADFGLSPSSRSGISVPGRKPEDKMDAFLRRAK